MGNADAESTVAPLPGKMATLRKILVHRGEEPTGPACLPVWIMFFGPRMTAGLHLRQVRREIRASGLGEAAAPFLERQCVFEHWPDQVNDPLALWMV
jgi:hypothetical protein